MKRAPKSRRAKQSKKRRHKSRAKRGLAPGTLMYVGDYHDGLRVTVTEYSSDTYHESSYHSFEELKALTLDHHNPTAHKAVLNTWIHVEGISDPRVVEFFGDHFAIHPLALEDILNTEQRPKLEEYEHYLFISLKSLSLSNADELSSPDVDLSLTEMGESEQLSMLLFHNTLLTFRERSDELFDQIKDRLRHQVNRVRRESCDYLLYAMTDRVVDEYFEAEGRLETVIEELEDRLFDERYSDIRHHIQQLRREVMSLKRQCAPLLSIFNQAPQLSSELIQEHNLRYFSDVQDHLLRVIDSLDAYRERVRGLQDLYLACLSNKMNETMKVLTIFASIFIPLTFIAGIYGMNFEHMPELKWRWAYPTLWLVFIAITVTLLRFFRRKEWF